MRDAIRKSVQIQEARKAGKFSLADAEAHLQSQGFQRNEVTNLSREEGGPTMHNWNKSWGSNSVDVSLYHNGSKVHAYMVNGEDNEPSDHDAAGLEAFKSHVG